jgi:hypothetical protein
LALPRRSEVADHPNARSRGRHKARIFAAALNLTQADAEFLRQELLRAAREAPGVYEVEFSKDSGQTHVSAALRSGQLMRLHHEPCHQAA